MSVEIWCILTVWHGKWGCRVMYERDMKVMNAATFTVQREDHTIGNVIRMYELHIVQFSSSNTCRGGQGCLQMTLLQ